MLVKSNWKQSIVLHIMEEHIFIFTFWWSKSHFFKKALKTNYC